MGKQRIDQIFPRLIETSWWITSPKTRAYNCIAWAAEDASRWWWPDPFEEYYWPTGVPRSETLDAFRSAYKTLGYLSCDSPVIESGFEKIAVYAQDGKPSHAARQIDDGRWTSKLGELEDIEHELHAVEGTRYGKVVAILRRPVDRTTSSD